MGHRMGRVIGWRVGYLLNIYMAGPTVQSRILAACPPPPLSTSNRCLPPKPKLLPLPFSSVITHNSLPSPLCPPPSQVIYFAALMTSNQDAAFMVAIAWTAINLLL